MPDDLFQHPPYFQSAQEGWERFYNMPSEQLVRDSLRYSYDELREKSKQSAFNLFHLMAKRVPAYKDFLSQSGLSPNEIQNPDDLEQVPLVDKANYLRRYPLQELTWDGRMQTPIISSSSGSSGTPTFWPRSQDIEFETTLIYEHFLTSIFEINRKKTLLINGFAMGIYVGGSFTLTACMRLSQKGYPLTIITPGINKKEIIESLDRLHPYFEQVILAGYPPLIKDILDECELANISIPKGKIRLFFAAEAISESFREYMHERIGAASDDYQASMNFFGTADAAIGGHEMPFTTYIRQTFNRDEVLCQNFFGVRYVPSINLTYPMFKYFEIVDEEVVLSSWNNAVPLCRYNLHDHGYLYSPDELLSALPTGGSVQAPSSLPFPYVALYGKTDNSVKLGGAIIYAESIKKALERPIFSDALTGKFLMQTKLNETKNQYLEVNIELKQSLEPEQVDLDTVLQAIIETLLEENAEYRAVYTGRRAGATPVVRLWPYQHPDYFSSGIKQRWARNS